MGAIRAITHELLEQSLIGLPELAPELDEPEPERQPESEPELVAEPVQQDGLTQAEMTEPTDFETD